MQITLATMPPKKAYESYESESDGESQPQKKKKSQAKNQAPKDSEEYRNRRERNNVAVRKSREASRKKAKETMDRVNELRDENKTLEQKVTILNKELGVLRDLFLAQASASDSTSSSTINNSNNNCNNSNSSGNDNSSGLLVTDEASGSQDESFQIETIDLEPEYFVDDHRFILKSDNSS